MKGKERHQYESVKYSNGVSGISGVKLPELFTAKVATQYRVTIPENIRENLDIKEGDYVVIHIGKVASPSVEVK